MKRPRKRRVSAQAKRLNKENKMKHETVTNPKQYEGQTKELIDLATNERIIQKAPYTRAELMEQLQAHADDSGSSIWDSITGRQAGYDKSYKEIRAMFLSKKNGRWRNVSYPSESEAIEAMLDYMMTGEMPKLE